MNGKRAIKKSERNGPVKTSIRVRKDAEAPTANEDFGGWNPPVDRNETRICRECNQTFKPTHVMQRSHAACEWA